MKQIIIILFILISSNSFGQYKVFIAVQDDEMRQSIINQLYPTDLLVVYERNASDYVFRVVTQESPLGVAASVVVTNPLTKGNEVWSLLVDAKSRLSLAADYELLDEIVYQSCVTAKDRNDMTKVLLNELLKVTYREKQKFNSLFKK